MLDYLPVIVAFVKAADDAMDQREQLQSMTFHMLSLSVTYRAGRVAVDRFFYVEFCLSDSRHLQHELMVQYNQGHFWLSILQALNQFLQLFHLFRSGFRSGTFELENWSSSQSTTEHYGRTSQGQKGLAATIYAASVPARPAERRRPFSSGGLRALRWHPYGANNSK